MRDIWERFLCFVFIRETSIFLVLRDEDAIAEEKEKGNEGILHIKHETLILSLSLLDK